MPYISIYGNSGGQTEEQGNLTKYEMLGWVDRNIEVMGYQWKEKKNRKHSFSGKFCVNPIEITRIFTRIS